jgi:hypothetical protein
MHDDGRNPKDMTDAEIRTFLEGVLSEIELEGISAEVRLTKAYNMDINWSNIAKRLIKQYTTALRTEIGEEAVAQFMKGIIAAVSN